MLTIKALRHITSAKRHHRLPDSLVVFLEKTFRELHVVHEPKVALKDFSLEMYGPIYVIEAGIDNAQSLWKLGLLPEESGMIHCIPEWVEKIDLGDYRFWRIGVMVDNDYLFQVILPVNEFGPYLEQWLEEQMTIEIRYLGMKGAKQ